MNSPYRSIVKMGGDADLAFAMVVLASYFATFSALHQISTIRIVMLIGMGIAYITIGIYGYAYCAKSNKLVFQLAYFLIQIPLAGTIIYLGQGTGFSAMIFLPLAGHSVVLLPTFAMYAVNILVAIAYGFSMYLFRGGWNGMVNEIPIFLAGQVFIMVFTQMAVDQEKARSEVERLLSELETANQRLREYAMQAEELAINKERNRLAREIHDGLGHYLTTINIQIQAAKAIMVCDPKQAIHAMDVAQSQAKEALEDVRRSVGALRTMPDENIPVPDRVLQLIKSCEGGGFEAELQVEGEERKLSAQAQLTIYRAAQEGLNNVSKHSKASQVKIVLDYSNPQQVLLKIKDNGQGSDKPEGGFGLVGIRERVTLLKGQMKIQSAPGQGFSLEIMVPE